MTLSVTNSVNWLTFWFQDVFIHHSSGPNKFAKLKTSFFWDTLLDNIRNSWDIFFIIICVLTKGNSCIMCLIRPLTACAAIQQFVCIPASNARVCCIRSPQTAACPCDQEACRREPTYLTEAPYEDTKSCGWRLTFDKVMTEVLRATNCPMQKAF